MGQTISGIGVLDRAVDVLSVLARGPRSLAELVDATGLPRATAHRLAVALEAHRLVNRDAAGRFVLGPAVGELAAAVPDPLVVAADPVLTWLRDQCGESTQLYRRDGAERVCLAAAERSSGLRTTVPVGSRLPLTAGSGAQVICAWAEPDSVAEILPAAAFTARTLRDVRRRGWAQSVAQREVGVASVSAPVLAADGRLLAAISVSGPVDRLGRNPGPRFAPMVQAGADRLAAALRR